MSSSSLLSFHTRIPLATTLPPPAGFFPPGPWVRTIRFWYVNVLSSPLAGWSLPWASITSQVDHLSLQTQDQVSIMTVTYFKYTLTILCTLAWTTWNFSSLVTIYQSSNHLPLWMSLESGRQTLRSPGGIYNGLAFAELRWPDPRATGESVATSY